MHFFNIFLIYVIFKDITRVHIGLSNALLTMSNKTYDY